MKNINSKGVVFSLFVMIIVGFVIQFFLTRGDVVISPIYLSRRHGGYQISYVCNILDDDDKSLPEEVTASVIAANWFTNPIWKPSENSDVPEV